MSLKTKSKISNPKSTDKKDQKKKTPSPFSMLKKETKAKQATEKVVLKKPSKAKKVEKDVDMSPSETASFTHLTKPAAPEIPQSSPAEDEEIPLASDSSVEDSESESEEEDLDGPDIPGIDISKLPTIAKDDAAVARKLARAKKLTKHSLEDERGVIYLGRIPHGFYEEQMKGYFEQFGEVTRLRLSRNKKTGHSKHYAFIEFASRVVAGIVQETMDNYLLMGRILQCKLLKDKDIHPDLWIGSGQKWRVVKGDRVERQRFNKPRTDKQQGKAEQQLLKRQEARKRKIEDAGIDYDMTSIEYKADR